MDELGSNDARRFLIIERPDGSTYGADIPESFDLADVLQPGEKVASDTRDA